MYLLSIAPTLLTPIANCCALASPPGVELYPGSDSRIVATFGDTTTKLAPPRSVNLCISLLTVVIYCTKV